MIKMSRKAKKAMAVALTAGMLASTATTPVFAATAGWKQNATGWWYQNADGSYPANKWEKINGAWYYFDANGYMAANAWAQDSTGAWYFLGADGAMLTNSWVKDSAGKWYFVGGNGAMLTNTWVQDSVGQWYWLTGTGAMQEGGWVANVKDGKTVWYFVDANGVMQSGVVKVDGKTYYLGQANDGSMKTGVVNISGIDYNFDEVNGNCTDEKAPVAAYKFDNKGNLLKEDIDVEEIDGVNAEVVNAIPQYAEYGSVVMTGDDAVIKVKVTNNGKPVAGTAVTLTLKYETGDGNVYESKSGAVSITDSNGYAPFVVGTDEKQTAVNGWKALYSYKATAVTSGEVYEGKLAFATIAVNNIKVDPDEKDKLEISTNAVQGDNSIETTTAMDGTTKIKYVKSQQVSLPNSDEHKVTFELNPELVIPVAKGKDVVSDYDKEINQTLGEYSVYENNEFWVKDIPAGIEYGTLNLENIDISENTKVVITTYKGGKTEDKDILNRESITGPKTDKNAKYQLPKVDDKTITALDVKIQILSEGQVNDGQNGGLTVKNVTGIYKQEGATDTAKVALTNPITWEKTEIAYSLEQKLENPGNYIPANYSDYLNAKYTYTYQVPVFPYVGNAIITVKDSNKKVLGYFTTPTENQKEAGKYKNVNVLTDTGRPEAILVTKDEAFNSVGTITPNGNRVTVNSDKTGVTAFKAKITINDADYDLTNDTINTSVHWSPIPSGVEAEDEFYALSGQKIVVKAQLVDKAGNKVSQSNENVTFYYNNAAIAEGSTGKLVTALSVKGKTDSEGRAYLELRATDVQAVLSGLTANSQNAKYDVVLVIGDQTVNKATLRWVTPGLAFNPDVDAPLEDVICTLDPSFNNEVSKDYISKYLTKDSGSQWIFGYKVNGDTQDDNVERHVSSIEGLKVNISQDGEATLVTDGMKNGAAKVSSANAYGTKLTGKINESSLTAGTDVIFHVAKTVNGKTETVDYKNVGEGTPYFEKDVALTLPVSFGEVGTKMEIVAPHGNRVVTGNDEDVYVKVTDTFGKPYASKDLSKVVITYTVTDGAGHTATVAETVQDLTSATKVYPDDGSGNTNDPATKLTTGTKGTVAVTVKNANVTNAPSGYSTVVKADIKVYYDDVDADSSISFVKAADVEDFLLLNAEYDAAGKKAVVTFNHEIANKEISKDMIAVLDKNNRVVGISSVEKSGKTITINFTEALDSTNDYTVKVLDGTDVDKDGTPDFIYDGNGEQIKSNPINNKLTVNKALLAPTYTTGSKITFAINTDINSTEKVLCVWEDEQGNSHAKMVEAKTGLILSSDINNNNVTEVTCYYNGAKEVVTLSERVAAIQAARTLINGTDFKLTEAAALANVVANPKTYGNAVGNEIVEVVTVPNFTATITEIKDDSTDPIFATAAPGAAISNLKLVNPKETKAGVEATITLTYTHNTYSSVKKTVTYKVTLKDTSTPADDTADEIEFKLQ